MCRASVFVNHCHPSIQVITIDDEDEPAKNKDDSNGDVQIIKKDPPSLEEILAKKKAEEESAAKVCDRSELRDIIFHQTSKVH